MNKEKKNRCLYKCESITDGYEYSKMVKYFPKRVYWVLICGGTFLNLIIVALIILIFKNRQFSIIFIFIEIYILIHYKICLEPLAEKIQNNRLKNGIVESSYENEFYDDFFIHKGKKSSITINYSEISRCVETDTNFY